MKIDRASEQLHAHQLAHIQRLKQQEFEYQQLVEKKKDDLKMQETRTERAKRLDLNKGRNVDVEC